MKCPIEDIYDRVWDVFESNDNFQQVVPDRCRVRRVGFYRNVDYEIAESDSPFVEIMISGIDIAPDIASNTSIVWVVFQVRVIFTGHNSSDLLKVLWAISESIVTARLSLQSDGYVFDVRPVENNIKPLDEGRIGSISMFSFAVGFAMQTSAIREL